LPGNTSKINHKLEVNGMATNLADHPFQTVRLAIWKRPRLLAEAIHAERKETGFDQDLLAGSRLLDVGRQTLVRVRKIALLVAAGVSRL
jgi:hypothetical protein